MKKQWKSWLYNQQSHTFVHKDGSLAGDTFLSTIRTKDEQTIQDYLDRLEFILKAENRTVESITI